MKKLLLAILSAAGVCTGCAAADGDRLLAPCEFRRAVAADTAAYVLDVRHAAWQKLTAEGFRAFDLEGGIIGWQKEGLPVVR